MRTSGLVAFSIRLQPLRRPPPDGTGPADAEQKWVQKSRDNAATAPHHIKGAGTQPPYFVGSGCLAGRFSCQGPLYEPFPLCGTFSAQQNPPFRSLARGRRLLRHFPCMPGRTRETIKLFYTFLLIFSRINLDIFSIYRLFFIILCGTWPSICSSPQTE